MKKLGNDDRENTSEMYRQASWQAEMEMGGKSKENSGQGSTCFNASFFCCSVYVI